LYIPAHKGIHYILKDKPKRRATDRRGGANAKERGNF